MSRKKAAKVFAIITPGRKLNLTDPTPEPDIHGYVLARHAKGALSIAKGMLKDCSPTAQAIETTPELAAKAINAKPARS